MQYTVKTFSLHSTAFLFFFLLSASSYSASVFVSTSPFAPDSDPSTGVYDLNVLGETVRIEVYVTEDFDGELDNITSFFVSYFVFDENNNFATYAIDSAGTDASGASIQIYEEWIEWSGPVEPNELTSYESSLRGGKTYELGWLLLNMITPEMTLSTEAISVTTSGGWVSTLNTGYPVVLHAVPVPAAGYLFISALAMLSLARRKTELA